MERKRLTPGALYMALNDELKRLRPPECIACRMPLPFMIERPDPVSANWRIGTPQPCSHGCDVVIAEIAARLWPEYDLRDPVSIPVKDPMEVAGGGADVGRFLQTRVGELSKK